jgi:transcriptional regulator with XRE-family HTH domain
MSEIERENASATVDLLERLAKVLGVELADFFVKPNKASKGPKALPVGRKPSKKR